MTHQSKADRCNQHPRGHRYAPTGSGGYWPDGSARVWSCDLLDAIAAALWPNGDPDAEWTADTTTAIGDLMTRAGYRPEPEVCSHWATCRHPQCRKWRVLKGEPEPFA